MKIRFGFVSNSSTSSFAIFGIWCENIDKIDKAIKKLAKSEHNHHILGLEPKDARKSVLNSLGLTLVNADYEEEDEDFDEADKQTPGVYIGLDIEHLGKGKIDDKLAKIKKASDALMILFKKEGSFISYAESDNW